MSEEQTLREAFERLPVLVRSVVRGLTAEQLGWRVTETANSIGWLVWHSARIQDGHIAELLDAEQLWVDGEWARDIGLEPDPDDTGYGYTPADVAKVRPRNEKVLVDYFDAVSDRTIAFIEALTTKNLDTIIDRNWDPPVTMRARLVSVLADDLQHLGQAAYVRGLLPAD